MLRRKQLSDGGLNLILTINAVFGLIFVGCDGGYSQFH
jgi:hypothetical protein